MATTYRCMDIGPDMLFVDERNEAIKIIQDGHWGCILCPQMFGQEVGYYGLFLEDNPKQRTQKEAEEWLSSIERSGRKAFRDDSFNPDSLSEVLPASLLPNQI